MPVLSTSPLLRQAHTLLDARDIVSLQNLVLQETLTAEEALSLYQYATYKIFEHPSATEEAHRDVRYAVQAIQALNRVFCVARMQRVINYPIYNGLTLIERVAGLPDRMAQSLVEPLLAVGSDAVRPDAYVNALHRALEAGNFGVLTVMHRAGLQLNGTTLVRALEHAAMQPTHALRDLVLVFGVDLSTALSDGGNVLHRIVRTSHTHEALEKLQYCSDMGVRDEPNNFGLRALEMAKYSADPRILARMETYFNHDERPIFLGQHPFIESAEQLKALSPDYEELSHYLVRCAKYGLKGENKIFSKTGYGVGAMAIELCDLHLLKAAFMEGESINAKVPRGAGLLGYAALMYEHRKERRPIYSNMFRLLLQQPGIDWDLYDADGMSVRMWVEYALLDKAECHFDSGVTRMLEASMRAKLLNKTRIFA